MKARTIVVIVFLSFLFAPAFGQIRPAAVFTDNMVLQQQTEAPIWGSASPGSKLKILTSWDKKEYALVTDKNGKWETRLSTPLAGGPYSIRITDGKKKPITIGNVLIGEVWICSGQSNMEMQINSIGQVANYKEEIAKADYPEIRYIKAEHNMGPAPLDRVSMVDGTWKVCSPETVAKFSAVAYFFGRNIFENRHVPIGLIDLSFGGTVIESWISKEYLEKSPDFTAKLKQMTNLPQEVAAQKKVYDTKLSEWEKEVEKLDKGYKNGLAEWASAAYDDSGWSKIKVPGFVENQGFPNFDGIMWFRKEITLPERWKNKKLQLVLGKIDDNDITFFNGTMIGRTEGWNTQRNYTVPAALVKAGKAVITVRLTDTGGSGGFSGNDFYIGVSESDRISLADTWKTQVSLTIDKIPFSPQKTWEDPNLPSVLFNGMVHPVLPFAVRGVLWYQGESNENRGYQYRDLLPLLISDWRKQWNANLPFYIVQLANYKARQAEPSESLWAELREAQARALHVEKTGLAVLIDIGEADNIHFRNKQDVGLRLALIARANTYGEKIVFSGPMYDSYRIEGDKIRIYFKYAEGGLKTKDNLALKGFAIAGPDHKYHWADAVIEGNEVLVSCPEVSNPLAVRYAWADNPSCNLYNGAGLPACPFRTDDWQGLSYGAK